MISAYDEESTSLAELKTERDLLRDALHDATQNAANWRAAYAALSLGLPDAPAVYRLLKRLLEENDELKEQRG